MIPLHAMTGSRTPRLHTLISSVSVLQSCESDVGVTIATGVSAWADLSGNGRHWVQGTAGSQPTYTANLAGFPVVTFDGSNDVMAASGFTTPLPGTTPTYVAFVAKVNTWGINRVFFGDTNTGANYPRYINCHSVTPDVYLTNGGSPGQNVTPMTIGSWFLVECYFGNSTSDFIRVGPTTATGNNAGNLYTSTGRLMGFGNATSMARGAFSIASVIHCNGLPTTAERAALRACVSGKYRGLVSV